jgi:hypothetical protein
MEHQSIEKRLEDANEILAAISNPQDQEKIRVMIENLESDMANESPRIRIMAGPTSNVDYYSLECRKCKRTFYSKLLDHETVHGNCGCREATLQIKEEWKKRPRI